MTSEIVDRVLRSTRYRSVDPILVARLAAEELPKARNADDAVKRVKRRLHQAVGAFRRQPRAASRWPVADPEALRAACRDVMRTHASTRERLPVLERFHAPIWEITGVPRRVLDLGCGLHPLAVPWMDIGDAWYVATDVDAGTLRIVGGFLEAVGQPHRIELRDLVTGPPSEPADVAFALKLVTTLDRQDQGAATRLVRHVRARHVVVSFAARSLGGRTGRGGRERTYRDRLDRLVAEAGRVRAVAEASVPNELVFVLTLDPVDADG
jgi:16S rRNA (guanine(1405)-N(7))-methyltransferase